jgi:hypothetical protein
MSSPQTPQNRAAGLGKTLIPLLGPLVARAVGKRIVKIHRRRKVVKLERQSAKLRTKADTKPRRRSLKKATKAERQLARAVRRATPRRQRRKQ